ncbi:MAG: hypothetical protein ACD_46C00695G0005 [uncultured bacterium]|nr:MAG: hypothetical protein ACD_46C00695G0005 [uncultured bacterium]
MLEVDEKSMKLYYSKGAGSLADRIIINELNLPCEYESVDLRAKKTETGNDFLKINIKGAVPTLIMDNGEVLTENAVILQHLADMANATHLLPPVGNVNRYRVLEWVSYISTELHKGCSPLFNPTIPQEVKETIFIPALKVKLAYLNQHLDQKKYLLGEDFTLPDAYLFVILSWLKKYFHFNLSDWPQIGNYFSFLQNRASIKKSLEQEGIIFN